MKPYLTGLYRQRDEILRRIKSYQEKCLHANAIKTPRGNTGNYDPSNDCYWIENKCPDCDRFWTTDKMSAR